MKVSHIPPFGVRMPPDLKEKIDMASKQSGRSMNAEIVYRLQKSFENPSKQSGSETGSASEDHRISSSDSRKLKGLLSRMLDMVEMAEQDEAREADKFNFTHEHKLMMFTDLIAQYTACCIVQSDADRFAGFGVLWIDPANLSLHINL